MSNKYIDYGDDQNPMSLEQAHRQLRLFGFTLKNLVDNCGIDKQELRRAFRMARDNFYANTNKNMAAGYNGGRYSQGDGPLDINPPKSVYDRRIRDGSSHYYAKREMGFNRREAAMWDSIASVHDEVLALRFFMKFHANKSSIKQEQQRSLEQARRVAYNLNERIHVQVKAGNVENGIIEADEDYYGQARKQYYFPIGAAWAKSVFDKGLAELDIAGKNAMGLRVRECKEQPYMEDFIRIYEAKVGIAQFKQGDCTWRGDQKDWFRIEDRFVAVFEQELPEGTKETLKNGTKWTVATSTTPGRAAGVIKRRMREHLVNEMMGGL